MTMRTSACRQSVPAQELGNYRKNLNAVPLLSRNDEVELAERIAWGDAQARERMIRANLRLVVHIAQRYSGRGLEPEDLVSEGYLGLITAADRFDPRFKVRFSTYASLWIKQAMRGALTNTAAMIRLPVHASNLLRKWRQAAVDLERARDREPTFDEIAESMGLTDGQRRTMQQALQTRHQAALSDERFEVAAPPEQGTLVSENSDQREVLQRRLERLLPNERTVITLRYGLGGAEALTLEKTGRRLGFTREWVRKIEIRALQKLC